MSKMDELRSTLYSQGSIDEKKLFTFTNAQKLPSGGFGLVGLGINGEKLVVFSAEPGGAVGKVTGVLYEIPMNEIENFKMGKHLFILSYMQFTWQGGNFYFKNNGMCGVDEAVKKHCAS